MIARVFVWRFYIIPPQGRPHIERRLAAILVADVVGYSRMMREDEARVLAQLKTLRKEVFDPRTAKYNGPVG